MNKKNTAILILFTCIITSSFAQTDSAASIYKGLDTITRYHVSLASGPAKDCSHFDAKYPVKYFVNCKEVSKEVYLKYKEANDRIAECTPCYMKMLDTNGVVVRIAAQYTDCAIGNWTEYYPNGKIKVTGHYKENDTGNWNNLWKRGYCSRKEGDWIYYDENGNIIKREKYKDNELVE
jgi:hypothetical protein